MHTHHSSEDCHGHAPAGEMTPRRERRLRWVLAISAIYMVAEIVGGWLTGSLALLADGVHMLSDVGALALALVTMWMARRPTSKHRTYGWHRAEVLAALANALTLILLSAFVVVEAWERWQEPPEVAGGAMLTIALGGLIVNSVGLVLLHRDQKGDLNLHGAWLHILGDLLGSIGALTSGLLIWRFGWLWADPLASAAIALLICLTSIALFRETIRVLLEESPARLDPGKIEAELVAVDGVESVHDLHVWTIASGREVLTAHVVADDPEEAAGLLPRLKALLSERYSLHHVTLQVECPACCEEDCGFELSGAAEA